MAPADLIIGFGHFDARIPQQCGRLWLEGRAPRILFTGGIGAGTADLGQPEALYFRDQVLRLYPDLPPSALLIEADSRHTGENIENSTALLQRTSPEASFHCGIRHVILVATPARQRRVWLACRKHWSHLRLSCAPPQTTFEADHTIFAARQRNLVTLMMGEMDRILTYPAKGYIAETVVPPDVLGAYRRLQP